MTSNNKYNIYLTSTFKKELNNIIYYLKNILNEELIANKFYKNVIKRISSLNSMPERYSKINGTYFKIRNLRKTLIDNYIIIYEVNQNVRTSFHSTYISL